jgi:hypothetical protein
MARILRRGRPELKVALHKPETDTRVVDRLRIDAERLEGMVDADAGFAILNSIVF